MVTATSYPGSRQIAKRAFDVTVSLVALVVLSPLMALIALAVAIWLGRPIFFRQARPGLHGELFDLVKFRTMTDETDGDGKPLPEERRMTGFGRFLRATSLDELPELWNVLKGEMSLVGPRPLLVEYLPLYSPHQARRHDVRPGITGWAQVKGRNALSWEQKFELDVWYVDNQAFSLDLRIILITLVKIMKREGINARAGRTMERFTGSVG